RTDTDAVRPKTIEAGAPAHMATASPADPGVVEEPLADAANANTTGQLAESQPTRAHGTLAAANRVGYFRPVHRYSLMLGIGYGRSVTPRAACVDRNGARWPNGPVPSS